MHSYDPIAVQHYIRELPWYRRSPEALVLDLLGWAALVWMLWCVYTALSARFDCHANANDVLEQFFKGLLHNPFNPFTRSDG